MYKVNRENASLPSHGLHQPMGASEKAWIFGSRPALRTPLRLFCFPNAGGGASTYVPWVSGLASEVDVYPVQLPGRENRLGERPIRNMDEMSRRLAQALLPYCDRPFAFFGHSMGALICFALTRYLRQQEQPLPVQLFLSAYRAPHLPLEDHLHGVPDDELVHKMLTLNGTKQEVFAHPELRRLLLPIFRADFELCETYAYTHEIPLDIPITAFGGIQDNRAGQKDLEGWREHTSKTFKLHMLPGDHFFWHSDSQATWHIIAQSLAERTTTFSREEQEANSAAPFNASGGKSSPYLLKNS
jgi:medium-chain acyl-[acyl-carrier-protein] hydrolase